jgi:cell division protein FtsA
MAASESVLTRDEQDLGVALIDVGGGTTDLAIFEKGSIWHTAVLPAGGDHFTNDLAVGLGPRSRTPSASRRKHGCALATLVEGGRGDRSALGRRPQGADALAAGDGGDPPAPRGGDLHA